MKKTFLITLTIFSVVLLSTTIQSCYYDNEEYLYGTPSATCDTASIKYTAFIKPLMDAQCATSGCHNAASAAAGVNLSTYTATKSYITNGKDAFLTSMKRTSGYMPKNGSKLATCDIAKIEAWIIAGMPNN